MAAYQEKRLAASQALTVASAAGAAVSTTIFGSETYAIAVSGLGFLDGWDAHRCDRRGRSCC